MNDAKPESGFRGRIGQAVLAYVAVSYIVLQVVDLFREGLDLPGWVFPSVLALLVAGLPIAIAVILVRNRAVEAPRDVPFRPTRRQAILGGIVLGGFGLAIAAYGATRAMGIGPGRSPDEASAAADGSAGSLLAQGVLERQDRILLAEFENRTADSLLAQTITEALAIDLSQSSVVRVVGREGLSSALVRAQLAPGTPLTGALAREIAVREGIAVVVEGAIAPIGSGYIITAHLTSVGDGAALASLQERVRDDDDLLAGVDRLSAALRDRIGESLGSIRSDPPLPRVTTSSLIALRAYAQSRRIVDDTDGHEKVTALLEEAVAADSTFAMAWRELGQQYRITNYPRAVAAWTKAWELRDRLTERERHDVTAQYHMWVTNDLSRAAAAYETLLALEPEYGNALDNLSILYDRLQNFERAELIQRQSLQLDSTSSTGLGSLVRILADQGKFDEAGERLAALQAIAPEAPFTYMMDASLAIARGDRLRTEERLRALGRDFNDSPYQVYLSYWFLAMFDATAGRLASARANLEEAERVARDMDSFALAYTTAAVYAPQVELVASNPDRARGVFRDAARRHPFDDLPPGDQPLIDAARMEALLGSTAVARQHVARFTNANSGQADDGEIDHIDGLIALAEGDFETAISRLRASSAVGCVLCRLADLGRAYEAAGNPDSAIAVYRRFIDTPSTNRLWAVAVIHTGPVLERLSHLSESTGDTDGAARYAIRLIELWADADAQLQPQVELARNRVTRLRPTS